MKSLIQTVRVRFDFDTSSLGIRAHAVMSLPWDELTWVRLDLGTSSHVYEFTWGRADLGTD